MNDIENNMENQIKFLEDLISDQDFINLEQEYNKGFNIFNIIGMNTQEIRHSNFLAWLFNPKEKHGLNDFFLKNFLLDILKNNSINLPPNCPTIIDIDSWDMSETIVTRENCNIDILFVDAKNSFVCLIENKIKAKQRDQQLDDYRKRIEEKYSDFNYKMFLFLKPYDDEYIDNLYMYVSYNIIKNNLEKILKMEISHNNELLMIIEHYINLLEREVMRDEKIEEICNKIYNKHKEAFNLVYKNVDLTPAQTKIAKILIETFKEKGFKKVRGDGNRNIYFLPNEVDVNQGFFFKIWNTGGSSDRYELKVELNYDKNFDKNKIADITKRLKIKAGAKKIKEILSKDKLININETIAETGCLSLEQENELAKNFSKILVSIKEANITEVLTNN